MYEVGVFRISLMFVFGGLVVGVVLIGVVNIDGVVFIGLMVIV